MEIPPPTRLSLLSFYYFISHSFLSCKLLDHCYFNAKPKHHFKKLTDTMGLQWEWEQGQHRAFLVFCFSVVIPESPCKKTRISHIHGVCHHSHTWLCLVSYICLQLTCVLILDKLHHMVCTSLLLYWTFFLGRFCPLFPLQPTSGLFGLIFP